MNGSQLWHGDARQRDIHVLSKVPLFQSMGSEQLDDLLDQGFERLEFARGDVIVREERAADSMYVIVAGRASASTNGRHTRDYKTGDSFGELALMHAFVQTVPATVKVTKRATCLRIHQNAFRAAASVKAVFHSRSRNLGVVYSESESDSSEEDVASNGVHKISGTPRSAGWAAVRRVQLMGFAQMGLGLKGAADRSQERKAIEAAIKLVISSPDSMRLLHAPIKFTALNKAGFSPAQSIKSLLQVLLDNTTADVSNIALQRILDALKKEHDAVVKAGEVHNKVGQQERSHNAHEFVSLPGKESVRTKWSIGEYVDMTRGLAVTGLAVRGQFFGQAVARTPIVAAISANNEHNVNLLLDNYLEYTKMPLFDECKVAVQHTPLLTESDMVYLFRRFPERAADFLVDLQLRKTPGLVDDHSRCDFQHDTDGGRLIRSCTKGDETGRFWEHELDVKWSSSQYKDKSTGDRQSDHMWGVSVESNMLPLVGICHEVLAETEEQRVQRQQEEEDLALRNAARLDAARAKKAALKKEARERRKAAESKLQRQKTKKQVQEAKRKRVGAKPSKESESRDEETGEDDGQINGDEAEERESDNEDDGDDQDVEELIMPTVHLKVKHVGEPQRFKPFSQLLMEAVRYANARGNPTIFESKALQLIIEYKWKQHCRWMYQTLFAAHVVYTLSFMAIGLVFEKYRRHELLWVRAVVWSFWAVVSFYTVLRVKYLLRQIRLKVRETRGAMFHTRVRRAFASYFADKWNWVDFLSVVATSLSLGLGAVGPAARLSESSTLELTGIDLDDTNEGFLLQDANANWITNCHALAGITCGFKILFYCKGLQQTAFLINMLDTIFADIGVFLLVLAVMIGSFAYSYYLLFDTEKANNIDGNDFDSLTRSMLSVFFMAFDPPEVDFFTDGGNSWLGVPLVLLYYVLVPVVMLNALIAIMQETYARVQTVKVSAGLLEQSVIILEMESLAYFSQDSDDFTLKSAWSIARLLLTIPVQYSKEEEYVHVLNPKKAESLAQKAKVSGHREQMRLLMDHVDRAVKNGDRTHHRMDKIEGQLQQLLQKLAPELAPAAESTESFSFQDAMQQSRSEALFDDRVRAVLDVRSKRSQQNYERKSSVLPPTLPAVNVSSAAQAASVDAMQQLMRPERQSHPRTIAGQSKALDASKRFRKKGAAKQQQADEEELLAQILSSRYSHHSPRHSPRACEAHSDEVGQHGQNSSDGASSHANVPTSNSGGSGLERVNSIGRSTTPPRRENSQLDRSGLAYTVALEAPQEAPKPQHAPSNKRVLPSIAKLRESSGRPQSAMALARPGLAFASRIGAPTRNLTRKYSGETE
eukprot:COSAG05_NODE_235_length_13191_cov_7.667354_2_plen_1333_part_00